MARKRTLVVEKNEVTRREWRLTLSSSALEFREELIGNLRELAKKHDLVIVNPVDPFAVEPAPEKRERKKKQPNNGQAELLEG